jgi:hypothetical protein
MFVHSLWFRRARIADAAAVVAEAGGRLWGGRFGGCMLDGSVSRLPISSFQNLAKIGCMLLSFIEKV